MDNRIVPVCLATFSQNTYHQSLLLLQFLFQCQRTTLFQTSTIEHFYTFRAETKLV